VNKLNNIPDKILGFFLEKELQSLFLIAPIVFALGIITFFNLNHEPSIIYAASTFIGLVFATIMAKRFRRFFFISLFATFFVGGFLSATIRTNSVKSVIVENDNKPVWIRADVEKIERQEKQYRLTLKNVDLWRVETKNFPPEKTPKRIRVTVKTKIDDNVRTGDRVAFKAILMPPAEKPIFPTGYDFAKVAYFDEIGGVGYALNRVKLFTKQNAGFIERFQDYFYYKVKESVKDDDVAGIIVSQITADKVEISDDTKEKMRDAGLGHLIAISGLNMSVAMVWLFMLSRSLLALWPRLALQHDVKKISVFVAVFFGFLYLLVTGMPISAVRAFLMVLLFFIAVLFDRFSISLHPVAFAAMAIMIFAPEQILYPSFQLSFAAVIGLIGMYEIYERHLKSDTKSDRSFVTKWLYIFAGIVVSTFFTSMTTAPFGIMHFGKFQNYGIVANMIGVPVVSVLVLPFSFLSIAAMPLGIEKPFLAVAEFGSKIIRDTSYFVGGKEQSVSYMADIPSSFIIYVVAGFLWLFIFNGRIRWVGVPIILLGYFMIFQKPTTPDFVINETASLIAMKQDDGSYKFFGINRESFALYQFTSKLGVKNPDFIKSNPECNRKKCVYKNIAFGSYWDKSECEKYDYMFNLGKFKLACDKALVVDKAKLKEKGTHLIYMKDNKLVTASDSLSDRVWSKR
jgi:competence protein ComEC